MTEGTSAASDAVTLADLEQRVARQREQPARDQDALIVCDRLVRVFTGQGGEV
ncbi:ABC transporter, partial [Streptomyces sp. Ru72]